jgi:hypothetical protein
LAALIGMPESIKYMALHKSQRRNLQKLIADIRPDFARAANARFVVEDEKQYPGFNPIYLFRDGLAVITPLLWLLFALNLMGYFFLAELDTDTAGCRAITANDGRTCRRDVASRWHGWRADTLPLARGAPLLCCYGLIRDRRTNCRLDRLCGGHLALGSDRRRILRGLLRTRYPVWDQCGWRPYLSHFPAR